MINNFMCEDCSHYFVCDKLSKLMKFHQDAKTDLGVEITMNDCKDYSGEDVAEENDE